jgi:flagellar basal-body rod protein FlgC
MDLTTSLKICGSGLAAQRAKLEIVTSNLTNVNTTRTPEGGPYRKKTIAFATEEVAVKVDEVKEDVNGIKMVYDPSHPDADTKGYVAMPNINVMAEMADMMAASRAYEACVTAFEATKNMTMKTLEMGR